VHNWRGKKSQKKTKKRLKYLLFGMLVAAYQEGPAAREGKPVAIRSINEGFGTY
jgi:hypothetical protein